MIVRLHVCVSGVIACTKKQRKKSNIIYGKRERHTHGEEIVLENNNIIILTRTMKIVALVKEQNE